MPLTLAKLQAKRAAAEIDFGDGDILHVEYFPERITGEMMINFAAVDTIATLAENDPERAMAVVVSPTKTLSTILASWDFAETIDPKTGKVTLLPLDEAHIAALGIRIQWRILNGIINAENDTTGKSGAPMAQAQVATAEVNGSPNAQP